MAVGDTIGGAGFNQGYAQNLSAEVGEAAPYVDPYLVQALGGMPAWYQAMGATAYRGKNTILTGGWADRRAARKRFFRGNPWDQNIGTVRGAIRNNNLLTTKTWSRYASQGMFFEDKYSPVGMAAGAVNYAARKGWLGTTIGGMAAEGGGDLIRGGLLSQSLAAERLGKGGDLSGRQTKYVSKYLTRAADAGVIAAGSFGDDVMNNPIARRTLMYATMKGPGGAYVGGYMSGLKNPLAVNAGKGLFGETVEGTMRASQFRAGARASSGALRAAGASNAEIAGKIGMKRGGQLIANAAKIGKGQLAKTAAAVGIKAVGSVAGPLAPIFWAWTAYDIAKAIVPKAPEFAADVYRSYTGWGNRRMFGAPFKTNEAAITSRQRGVMAIQNSRLNARSVIGAEASGVHAYFG